MIIFGASRGFGREVFLESCRRNRAGSYLLVARKLSLLQQVKEEGLRIARLNSSEINSSELKESQVKLVACDLSSTAALEETLSQMNLMDQIIYVAAGGPFGFYQEKEFKDHLWSLQVSFISLAKVLHWALRKSQKLQRSVRFVSIGSAVAEERADPQAASYCASKHGVLGLVRSIQEELKTQELSFDLRHFSPTYMDTDLLPPNAWPRQKEGLVVSPQAEAERLFDQLDGPNR